MILHEISPIYNTESKILILGSFPSVKSRKIGFFYGHPQNRFWKVISSVYGKETPKTVDEKRKLLLEIKVAVWDVIGSCEIQGSADSTISNVTPNDIAGLVKNTKIDKIYLNGQTAKKCFDKYVKEIVSVTAETLPSTSPANAVWALEKLISAWQVIKR